MCIYIYFITTLPFHHAEFYVPTVFPSANRTVFSTNPIAYMTIRNNHATRTQMIYTLIRIIPENMHDMTIYYIDHKTYNIGNKFG